MGKNRSTAGGTERALVTSVVALLFLVQTLAFILSPTGRIAFSSSAAGASIAMAGEICHINSDDSGKTPSQPSRHHHCALCTVGNCAHEADALSLTPSVAMALALPSRDEDAPGWPYADDLPSLPVGWTSSWSSRAPPPIG
jgi:hypothetical protein